MRIHYLQHTPFENTALIKKWAQENGCAINGTRIHKGEPLPDPDTFDLLISLGGPQNICELEKYQFLKQEVEYIRDLTQANKKILGICLGAQIISAAFGALPESSPEKEVGLFPVSLNDAGQSDPILKGFPNKFNAIHWHYRMPGLPKGATILGNSQGCPRQIIKFQPNIYGIQFHLEIVKDSLHEMFRFCGDYFDPPSPYTQEKSLFMDHCFNEPHTLLKQIMNNFLTV